MHIQFDKFNRSNKVKSDTVDINKSKFRNLSSDPAKIKRILRTAAVVLFVVTIVIMFSYHIKFIYEVNYLRQA